MHFSLLTHSVMVNISSPIVEQQLPSVVCRLLAVFVRVVGPIKRNRAQFTSRENKHSTLVDASRDTATIQEIPVALNHPPTSTTTTSTTTHNFQLLTNNSTSIFHNGQIETREPG